MSPGPHFPTHTTIFAGTTCAAGAKARPLAFDFPIRSVATTACDANINDSRPHGDHVRPVTDVFP